MKDIDLDRSQRPVIYFDNVVEWIIAALVIFAPLAYGTTEAWSQEVFVFAIAAAAIVVCLKHVVACVVGDTDRRFAWTWVYLLIALFLALCAIQSTPLPAHWLDRLSPGTLRLKSELLSHLPSATASLRQTTISFYPLITCSQTVLVASVAVLFVVVLDVYRDASRIRRLLSVIACVGLAVAGIALYQNFTNATTIYGLVPAGHPSSGPFMNHGHFGQFMNLSVGAAFAVLLIRTLDLADYYRTPGELLKSIRHPRNAMLWAAAATCVLGPVTVFLSLSRMGMISMLVSAITMGALLVWRGRSPWKGDGRTDGYGSLIVLAGLTVFAVLLYAGFDVVYARLATVRHFNSIEGGRTEIVRNMFPIFRQFPILGTGLGTHEFVFPMFDHTNVSAIATHASNEYAQLMEETGAAGVLLAIVFIGVVVVNFVRAIQRPIEPITYAAFGIGFGLLAILIHSGSDFGQHEPANACLTAIFSAILFTLSRDQSSQRRPSSSPHSRRIPAAVGWTAVTACVVASTAAAGLWTDRARNAAALWGTAQTRDAEIEKAQWVAPDASYIALIKPAAAAAALEPSNITFRYWTDVYRWHAIARSVDPDTGRVRLPAVAVPFAAKIVDDLQQISLVCPTYGPPLCVAGQINFSVLNQPALGRSEIEIAKRLTPYDRTVSLVDGLLAVHDKRWSDAHADFARDMLLGGSLHDCASALVRAGHPEIAYSLAGDDRQALLYLASQMSPDDPQMRPWIARCRSDANALLEKEIAAPGAAPASLVEMAGTDLRDGKTTEAILLYQRALQSNYSQVDWRLELAQLLFDTGRYAEAAREARVCLTLRPQSSVAQTLLTTSEAKAERSPAVQ